MWFLDEPALDSGSPLLPSRDIIWRRRAQGCVPALPLTGHVTLGQASLLSLSFLIYKTGIIIIDNSCTYPASEVVRITCVNACHELTIMPGLRKCQQMEAINIANTYFRSRLTLPAFLKLSINNRETRG